MLRVEAKNAGEWIYPGSHDSAYFGYDAVSVEVSLVLTAWKRLSVNLRGWTGRLLTKIMDNFLSTCLCNDNTTTQGRVYRRPCLYGARSTFPGHSLTELSFIGAEHE